MNQKRLSPFFPLAILLCGLFLTACQAVDVPVVESKTVPAATQQEMMAQHIQFQDQLDQPLSDVTDLSAGRGVSMAQRIQFQDQLDQPLSGVTQPPAGEGMSMAQRIQFQDQLDQPLSSVWEAQFSATD